MLERLGRLSPGTQRVLLLAGCLLLYFVWLTRVPLTEIDEVRYSEATREMLVKQDYVIPFFNGVYRFQKPILYYWIQSVPVRLLGVNEVAARLPSAVLATVLVLLLHALLLCWLPRSDAGSDEARARRGRGAALLGAAALATMPVIAIWARAATTDITLTLFIVGALLAMLHADLLGASAPAAPVRAIRGWYLLAALSIGLAFLTKGPMGLLIPALAWVVYHGLQRNLRVEARRFPWVLAILIFLAVTVPWYAATYVRVHWQFLQHFFMEENVGRFSTVMQGHGSSNRLQALGGYLLMIIATPALYTAFLLREFITPFGGDARLNAGTVLPRMRRFALVWFCTVIAIFAPSKTQLPSYIQSFAPAIAILFSIHILGRLSVPAVRLPRTSRTRWAYRVELFFLSLLGVIFVAGPIYALLQDKVSGPLGGEPFPHPMAEIALALVAVVGLPLLGGMVYWSIRRNAAWLIGWTMSGWSLLLLVLFLAVAPLAIRSSYRYSVDVGTFLRTCPPGAVVNYSAHPSEDLTYYAQRTITLLSRNADSRQDCVQTLRDDLAREGRVVVVTDMRGIGDLYAVGHMSVLKEFGDIRVIEIRPLLPGTLPHHREV
jgi:4-amino-4-deoxy-L-arabinose transferase-like glycosyltransferase